MTHVDFDVKVMGHFKMLLAATLCLLNLVPIGEGAGHRNYWDMTFTVVVPPETPEQCYHIPDIKFRQDVDVFFQVVKAYHKESGFHQPAAPDMNINMQVFDPAGTVLKSAINGQFENYRFNAAATEGDHKVCFFSYHGHKNVYVRVSVSTPSGASPEGDGLMTTTPWDVYDYFYDEDRDFNADVLQAMRKRDQDEVASQFDTTVKVIKESLQTIRGNLQMSSSLQGLLMSTLTKDMFLMINNHSKVNFWSLVYISVLVMTGLLQVFMIKRLFDDQTPHKIRAST